MPALQILAASDTPLSSVPEPFWRPRYSMRGRLCFEKPPSPQARTLQSSCSANRLWSPAAKNEPFQPLEQQLPGLFIFPSSPRPKIPAESVAGPSQTNDGSVCCICFEAIDQLPPLSCPQCSMRAHPGCLAKWFGSVTTKRSATSIPSSTASCPHCRNMLDWDALALKARMQSRRRRMPLGQDQAEAGDVLTRIPAVPKSTRSS